MLRDEILHTIKTVEIMVQHLISEVGLVGSITPAFKESRSGGANKIGLWYQQTPVLGVSEPDSSFMKGLGMNCVLPKDADVLTDRSHACSLVFVHSIVQVDFELLILLP